MKAGDLVGGRFRIEQKIAAGGMGVVFRARDEHTGFTVAVKLFDIRTEIDIERAHRESQSLARLAHPAIVAHIADGVTNDGQLYLAMEWIEGVTAGQRIGTQGFSLREMVAVARRIASALAAAHGLGIIHRDIKPSNVLLPDNQPETAMLIDFGVARVGQAAPGANLTRTGVAIGTPGYMSPEQARGIRTLTPAVDVFGLGCLLYELATGEPAFSGSAPAAILAKILFADIAPINVICTEAPEDLSRVIEKMMSRDLKDRYPDAKTVLAELDKLGKIPEGPRRVSRRRAQAVPAAPKPQVHCMVMASHGPQAQAPSGDEYQKLIDAGSMWDAQLELFESGEVCAHLQGEPKQTTHRAACLALAMRRLLPGWSIAISTEQDDADAAAETGTALLTSAAIATIFKKMPGEAIMIDPASKPALEKDFDIQPHKGVGLSLIGPRTVRG